jgi:hypothetical protein
MKSIEIHWDNFSNITVELLDNPAANYLWESLKHLQNLPLQIEQFEKENPFNEVYTDSKVAFKRLIETASNIGVDIQIEQEISQNYLNQLHKIYEENYDGKNQQWLVFHEMIHVNEMHISNRLLPGAFTVHSLGFDWREKAGIFNKPYDRNFNKFAVTELPKGSVYLKWQELGKKPYRYWYDGEPNDTVRVCELAKPWIEIRPAFHVTTRDIKFDSGIDLDSFNQWFEVHRNAWCQHWNLTDWTPEEMYTVLPVGHIYSIDQLIERFQNKQYPTKVKQL